MHARARANLYDGCMVALARGRLWSATVSCHGQCVQKSRPDHLLSWADLIDRVLHGLRRKTLRCEPCLHACHFKTKSSTHAALAHESYRCNTNTRAKLLEVDPPALHVPAATIYERATYACSSCLPIFRVKCLVACTKRPLTGQQNGCFLSYIYI